MDYYEAPTDAIFNEVKAKAISIWKTYDDTYGYASEKINAIKDLANIQDNVMYIVAMFDGINQANLAELLSEDSRTAIRERMRAGGSPEEFIYF